MKSCNRCGATLDDNAMFCGNCGNNVASQTPNNNNNMNMNMNYSQSMNNGPGFVNPSDKMSMQMQNNNWSNMNNNQGAKSNKVLMWSLIGGGIALVLGIIIFVAITFSKKGDEEFDFDHGKEVLEVDPFDGLEVTFSGTDPNGRVDIRYNGDEKDIPDYAFSVDKKENLKIGDEVTVTFDEKKFHSIEYDSIKVKQKEKKYTCEKIDKNVAEFSEISKEGLDKIKKDVETKIDVYFSENSESFESDTPKYEGAYFLYKRDDKGNEYGSCNGMYLIYSSNFSSDDEYDGFSSTKVYHPYYVQDIVLKVDGSIEYRFDSYGNNPCGRCTIKGKNYSNSFYGFTDFDKMCKELLDGNKDQYNYKANDGIKEYKS